LTCLSFNIDGSKIAVGSKLGIVEITDLKKNTMEWHKKYVGHKNRVNSCCFIYTDRIGEFQSNSRNNIYPGNSEENHPKTNSTKNAEGNPSSSSSKGQSDIVMPNVEGSVAKVNIKYIDEINNKARENVQKRIQTLQNKNPNIASLAENKIGNSLNSLKNQNNTNLTNLPNKDSNSLNNSQENTNIKNKKNSLKEESKNQSSGSKEKSNLSYDKSLEQNDNKLEMKKVDKIVEINKQTKLIYQKETKKDNINKPIKEFPDNEDQNMKNFIKQEIQRNTQLLYVEILKLFVKQRNEIEELLKKAYYESMEKQQYINDLLRENQELKNRLNLGYK